MRLCILTEYFHPDTSGGTGMVLSELAQYLAVHCPDLEIDVITSKNLYRQGPTRLPQSELWEGMTIHRLRTPKSNRPSTALRLAAGAAFTLAVIRRLLVLPRYDRILVVTNPPPLPFAAWLLRRLRGTPYVYLVHDLYPDFAVALGALPRRGLPARGFAAAQKTWLHGSRRTIVLGRCMRDYLSEAYSLPSDQIDVVPNWSDPLRFLPDTTSRFRESSGLKGVLALYCGNLGNYVDLDTILDAAKLLKLTNPEITIALVGYGVKRNHVSLRVQREGLENVRLLPLVPSSEYPDLLAAADISLISTMPGSTGLAVPSKFYHILASGRPTVALVAPESEVALVLSEARCGIQVDHGDSTGLSEALGTLAASAADRAILGQNARQAFLRSYTLAHAADLFCTSLRA